MKKTLSGLIALLLLPALTLALWVPALAAEEADVRAFAAQTADYLLETVSLPQVGMAGGEWAVLGLARGGFAVPEGYFQGYCAAVEGHLAARNGVLHERKYTEYARVALALTALGQDPRDVAGYNLLAPLGDFDQTIRQGVNGAIWALIALDSGAYPVPQNRDAAAQATRQMYLDHILARQLSGGGWSLAGQGGGAADPDITGMALQALAQYQGQPAVREATEAALACMSLRQEADGGFSAWGADSIEGPVQMIVALCELGIPLDDARFVKGGNTLLGSLLGFRLPDGSFRHTADSAESSLMSTEQGLYALVAVLRAQGGQNSLYRMGDAPGPDAGGLPARGRGLPGRHADVKAAPITVRGALFEDVTPLGAAAAIEALAARGIITGKGGGRFDPGAFITRAEFAAILARGLGLAPRDTGAFSDVPASAWYAGCVGAASSLGLVTGVGGGRFNPEGAVTCQEAAAMAARAARLCGLEADLAPNQVEGELARFDDSAAVADWAREPLAFCWRTGITARPAGGIEPLGAITRAEMARMLFSLLARANLI